MRVLFEFFYNSIVLKTIFTFQTRATSRAMTFNVMTSPTAGVP